MSLAFTWSAPLSTSSPFERSIDRPLKHHTLAGVWLLTCLVFRAVPAVAQAEVAPHPRLSVYPAQPAPGAIARLTLRVAASDAVSGVEGTMAGEALHFVRASRGEWHAIGGVPVDAVRSVTARAVLRRARGASEIVAIRIPVPPIPKRRVEPLKVDTGFTAPDPAKIARIARENALARAVGTRAHASPTRWTASFLRPRSSRVTGAFGSGRLFNGQVVSRHLGVDFAGKVGEPVRAANRGVVALVDSFLLAGNVIYIDHGGGVVTGYFHLSKQLVAVGDTVERGQIIGAVGQSGRVTGPHLHWSVRYGAITVNPLDLLALNPAWYPGQDAERRSSR